MNKPNPGSDEAVEQGCVCPRLDNAYGKGYMGGVTGLDGEAVFVISGNCRMHNPLLQPGGEYIDDNRRQRMG